MGLSGIPAYRQLDEALRPERSTSTALVPRAVAQPVAVSSPRPAARRPDEIVPAAPLTAGAAIPRAGEFSAPQLGLYVDTYA